ncbi:MAG: hypothetical protein HWD84_06105 [Flavobacteriaceae bacterium]|nr:hypothetical protein [Flavobacteriaceae bacterium]
MHVDQTNQKFEEFVKEYEKFKSHDLSESDTRSKLIDFLLLNVLGWSESDILREGHVDSGYFDYKISIPGVHFVIEAKKQFIDFEIPKNHQRVLISTLYKSNESYFVQIRNYALDAGVQYGLLTNGKQFILAKLFNSDGKSWKENYCLIFNGIDEVRNRIVSFYENLSKSGVVQNGGFKFDYNSEILKSKTISSSLIDKDKEIVRNQFSAKLTPIIEDIFGEVFSEEKDDDEEFIKKCFVSNVEILKNKDEIQKLFEDKAPPLEEVIPAVNSQSIKTQIKDDINNDEISIKKLVPPKPIVVIGSKGSGKTTFINHLFKYDLNESEISDHFTVYADFRRFYELGNDINSSNIAKHILDTLYDKYVDLSLHSLKVLVRIYIKEIKRNDESIWQYEKENNQETYNQKLSQFLTSKKDDSFNHLCMLSQYLIRERRKRLLVIIDNGDQFDDSIQKQIFLFSHALAKSALCGAVISLREGYYYKWRNSPPFDAYVSHVYHVTAPRYTEVLQKRLDFALSKIEVDGKTSGVTESGFSVQIDNQSVIEFLSSLQNSLFSGKNMDLINFLSYTTYPNIREGLRVFKQYLTSGHTNVAEYIVRQRFKQPFKDRSESIPLHEFIKTVGLQSKHYYNSETSIIHNLFLPPQDTTDHFIKLYILKYLLNQFELKGNTGKFVSYENVVNFFSDLGYRVNTINECLQVLLKNILIDTDDQMSDIIWDRLPSQFNISITSKGYYYYKELFTKFHYMDLVIQDTPIFSNDFFEKMLSAFPKSDEKGKRKLDERLNCILIFSQYLHEMEEKQPNQAIAVFGKITTLIDLGLAGTKAKIQKYLKTNKGNWEFY